MGWRTQCRPEPEGLKWLRASMGIKAEPGDEGAEKTKGKGQPHRSWSGPLAFISTISWGKHGVDKRRCTWVLFLAFINYVNSRGDLPV